MVRFLAVVVSMLVALAGKASAFCGFYVAGSNANLTNDATQVVLMRKGTRTVLAMQNDYKGPPEAFALVVPVPVVLQKDDVKTLPKEVFAHVEAMGAPRLVEYWEQDPCPNDRGGLYGTIGHGSGTGTGYGVGGGRGGMRGRDLGVTVEATFAVGEYQIVILSAKDSTGLETWLRQENYKIPEGAEPLLRPYVESGMKFFVAKVDPSKVAFDANGRAALSPLRFHYDSDDFSLPIRLGLANSSGTQDLIVSIFAPYQRYEVANYKNVTIPTNIDVDDRVRGDFGAFYAQLFDRTLARNPGAVVTEYAWQATSCDPCTGPTLQPEELATLGGDVLDKGRVQSSGGFPIVSIGQPTVTGDLDKAIIRRYIKRNIQKVTYCYEKEELARPGLAGTITVSFGITADGKVTSTTGTGVSPEVARCVTGVISSIEFPKPKTGSVQVTYPFTFALGPGPGRGWGSDLVLTRLHARYGKEITNDLVFKKAEAIVGGREFVRDGGKLEEGARPDSSNNFQGRYAIRHPWKGPITCANPQRNVWGGPPPQETRPTQTLAATGIAFAARTGTPLPDLVKRDMPEIAVKATSPAPYAVPAEMPPAPAVGSGSGSGHGAGSGHGSGSAAPADAKPTPAGASGCGCNTVSDSTGGGLLVCLIALVTRRRRN
ncbi:MAG: DUF2330 domain-containing protein [Kofleriaceae bacterium]|nr:DUF2330 domain-containing protein [Kofleriaceae bacterium]